MGYLEDIRKVNSLAGELVSRHIVESRDDAVRQSKVMLGMEAPEVVSSAPTVTVQATAVQTEEWKEVVARNNQYIAGELLALRDAVNSLKDQLSSVQKSYVELKEHMARPAPVPAHVEKQERLAAEEPKGPSPRTGSYTSDNVSVEKFFYYGNKKA